jgi:hypothetical protein
MGAAGKSSHAIGMPAEPCGRPETLVTSRQVRGIGQSVSGLSSRIRWPRETRDPNGKHLLIDRNAREAVEFYASVFDDSEVLAMSYYLEGAPMPAGTELTIRFRIRGEEFLALLASGGREQQCGWLLGQPVEEALGEMVRGVD